MIMATSPTDLGNDFIKEGNRLITQRSSDSLLEAARQRKEKEEESKKD